MSRFRITAMIFGTAALLATPLAASAKPYPTNVCVGRKQEVAGTYCRRVLRAWGPDEILVTPTLTRLPAPVGALRSEAGVTDDAVRYSALVRPWNVTGQPAVSLPLARTADGTPVGVQLVGPPGGESLLLAVAAQLEAALGGQQVLDGSAHRSLSTATTS